MSTSPTSEPLHPIRVVVKRTGLSADVLRVWERRYGAVQPQRTDGDRRLYSDEDIERLLLLRRATDAGRSIGQVAGLATAELRDLVRQDEAAGLAAPPARPGRAGQPRADRPADSAEAERLLDDAFEAVAALDADRLEDALQRGRLSLSHTVLLERVLVPLLHRIGDTWREGTLRIAHEHLASAVVRTFLSALADGLRAPDDAPLLLVATPAGQMHELGAMMAAAAAASEGWRILYLGCNLPAEEIGAAARQADVRAVALSVVHPEGDRRLHDEMRRLARAMPEDVPVLVGGGASSSYRATLLECGFSHLETLPDLRRALSRARAS